MFTINVSDPAASRDQSLSWLSYWFLIFGLSFILAVCAYSKTLTDFLIFDDVGVLLYFNPNFTWLDCFRPMNNSVVRPANLLLTKLIWTFSKANPLPYHLASLLVHAGVAASTAVACRALVRDSWLFGAVAALAITVASAAFPTVYMISNSCDSIMALGIMLLVTQWTLYLQSGRPAYLFLTAVFLLLALAGKETAIVSAGIVLLLTWIYQPKSKWPWVYAGVIMVICICHVLLMLYLQKQGGASYQNTGLASATPALVIVRYLTFLPSTLFPGTFIMEPLWVFPGIQYFRLMLQLLTVLLLVLSAAFAMRSIPLLYRKAAVCYLSASALVWPALFLGLAHYSVQQQPSGRFVYASIPFMILAVCCVYEACSRSRFMKWTLIIAAFIWMLFQVVIIRKSPGTLALQRISKQWENLSEELGRVSATWPRAMYFIVVYTGESYGSIFLPENYGTALIRLYHPDLIANYYTNRVPPVTTHAYVFDGKKLLPASTVSE